MNLSDITPLVLSFNEEANIARCLERLRWASRIVVVDSGSTDATLAMCAGFPNAEVVSRPFDNHTAQWNHGLDQLKTRWVLTLDADYLLNDDFTEELQGLPDGEDDRVWFGQFHYVTFGNRLRGTLYPPRALLFDPNLHRYEQDGHTQSLSIQPGRQEMLETRIDHDDRKSLGRWLDSQRKYAALEAEKMCCEIEVSGMPDRLRRMIWPAAPAAFLYTLFGKMLILDGWSGIYYALQRTYAELLLSLELLDIRLRGPRADVIEIERKSDFDLKNAPERSRMSKSFGLVILGLAVVMLGLVLVVSWAPESQMTKLHWLPRWVAALADHDPNIRTAVPFIPVALLLVLGFSWSGFKWPMLWSVMVSGACLSLSEFGQMFLPQRTADVRDLMWGGIGIAVGAVAAQVALHRRGSM